MAGRQQGFYWKDDTLARALEANIKTFPAKLDRAITSAVEFQATRGESHMRGNAPWHDRTGNARAGLHTSTEHHPMVRHSIIFAHGVDYGIWLEISHDGKYSIIPASLQHTGRELMALIGTLLGKLGT